MLLSFLTGMLETPNRLPFHDSSRLIGRVSWVPRARNTPAMVVSVSAVNVSFTIGCAVRLTFANTNRLFDFIGSASLQRTDRFWLRVGRSSGLPAVSARGFELLTTFWSWLIAGAFMPVV